MSFINLNNQIPNEIQGLKIYRGIVIDNNDPLHLDRIKCIIPNLYDDSIGDVPWIIPVKHCIFGQSDNIGEFGVPPVGSIVCVQLQENDPNFPVYTGFLMSDKGSQNQVGVFTVIDQSGSKLTIDTVNKNAKYEHCTGASFEITKDGGFNVNIPQNMVTNIQGNLNATIKGNADCTINGNLNCTVNGNTKVKTSEANIECSGNITNKCATFIVEASVAQIKCPVQCGNISNTYGAGGAGATIKGGIQNTGGTISSNGIVLDSHTHTAPHGETSGPH